MFYYPSMMFVIAAQTYTSAIVTIIPEDHIFVLFVYICLLIYLFHTHTQTHLYMCTGQWRSKDNLKNQVPTFPWAGSGEQICGRTFLCHLISLAPFCLLQFFLSHFLQLGVCQDLDKKKRTWRYIKFGVNWMYFGESQSYPQFFGFWPGIQGIIFWIFMTPSLWIPSMLWHKG